VVAALVFLWAAYRSATVAITASEAVTYNHYASQPLLKILTAGYNPANQILHTVSCWLVLRVFRVTEWWLRLPSLMGLLFYFWAASKLCRSVCKSPARSSFATLICVCNPFTVGWLPVSSGAWTAAALVLLSAGMFLQNLERHRQSAKAIGRASLLLGVASGFDISFLIPAFALMFVFLHLNFWGYRNLNFWDAIHQVVLPALLVTFVIWAIPFLNNQTPVRFELSCVLLVPVLCVLSVPWLVDARDTWKLAGGTAALGTLCIVLLLRSDTGSIPNWFRQGPEQTMASVARALRDEIRLSAALRAVHVTTSPALAEPFNFYRRRYGLGAVQPYSPEMAVSAADYLVLLPEGLAVWDRTPKTIIFSAGQISLFRVDSR
jgi:hypothetical protein